MLVVVLYFRRHPERRITSRSWRIRADEGKTGNIWARKRLPEWAVNGREGLHMAPRQRIRQRHGAQLCVWRAKHTQHEARRGCFVCL
jgi:hypothetical protein